MTTHCGYVALLGRPNAGKSTLLNACLGQKIAGVSKKPQTTRNRILGLDVCESSQIIFLDTPGMHKAQGTSKMNRMMNKEAWSVLSDCDVACYMIDIAIGMTEQDSHYLESLLTQKRRIPTIIIASKTDSIKNDRIKENLNKLKLDIDNITAKVHAASISETESPDTDTAASTSTKTSILEPYPYLLSAKRPEEVVKFRKVIAGLLPEGPFLFDADALTDRPQKFVIGELIREQVFRQLGDELPYGMTVFVDSYDDSGFTTKIRATIFISRKAHKSMVVGKGGGRIKSIGMASRESIEKHIGNKVFLDLFVKVQENWINDEALVSQLQGILSPDA